MSRFSIFEYNNLPAEQKDVFNKALALKISSFLSEIKNDDVLKNIAGEDFVLSLGESDNAFSLVSELYSKVSSGVQAGSGNQNLFLGILNTFVESWEEIIK